MPAQLLDIAAARRSFADAIAKSQFVPESAQITIRNEPALGEAGAIHCKWPLLEKGPYSGNYSREITMQITARAMNQFRAADPKKRGTMLRQFIHTFEVRLLDGQYDEKDPSPPEFIVSIDEHDLEP